MNKALYLFFLFVCCLQWLMAQPIMFKTTYGSNNDMEGRSVAVLHRGGFLLCGSNGGYNAGSADLFLVKTHSNGLALWTRNYGGGQSESGNSVFEDTLRGRYLASGIANTTDSSYQAYIVCTDTAGNLLWQKYLGGEGWDAIRGGMQQDAVHYLFWGYTSDSIGMKPWIFQTDTAGNLTWQKTFPTSLMAEVSSVCRAHDGNLFFCGHRTVNDSVSNMVYGKLLPDGSEQWLKQQVSAFDEKANQVTTTASGRLLVFGYTKHAPQGNENFYLLVCNSSGDTLFTANQGSYDHETGASVAVSADGYYATCGQTAGPGYEQILLFKIDSLSNYQAATTYLAPLSGAATGLYHAYARYMCATPDSGFIIAGTLYNTQLLKGEPYLIKTDRLGNTSTAVREETARFSQLYLYPSPAQEQVCIKGPVQNISAISACSADGTMHPLQVQENRIPTEGLLPGPYVFLFLMKDNSYEVHRVVVAK